MSDLETDSKHHEINAAKVSPWPDDMRDQIWGDRLLLRFKMKREMKDYRAFLEEVVKKDSDNDNDALSTTNNDNDTITHMNIQDAIPILKNFCTTQLSPHDLHQLFQLQRADLTEILKSKYKITSAYAIVFCAVVEQLSNFHHTGYGVDAPPTCCCDGNTTVFDEEGLFETVLHYNSRGQGFHLNIAQNILIEDSEEEWKVNEETLDIFLKRMVSLAGPTLLARAAKVVTDDDDDNKNHSSDDDDDDGTEIDNRQRSDNSSSNNSSSSNKPSFRSDRRVARLMIARYWADRLIEKYRSMQEEVENQSST